MKITSTYSFLLMSLYLAKKRVERVNKDTFYKQDDKQRVKEKEHKISSIIFNLQS